VFASSAEKRLVVEAAVDGFVDDALTARLNELQWPQPDEPYLYKQLFVFRLGK
jgi:hypothetical protein